MPCASRSSTTVSHQLPTQLQEAERERGDGCIWFHAGPIYRRLLQHCCRPDVIRLQEIVLPRGLMERTEVTLSPSLFCLYASTFQPRICFLFGFFLIPAVFIAQYLTSLNWLVWLYSSDQFHIGFSLKSNHDDFRWKRVKSCCLWRESLFKMFCK